MIDIHCHILPGIDDGPRTLDVSIAMCRIASSDGIQTIVATPHFKPGSFKASSDEVFTKIEELKHALQEEAIHVDLLAGADISVVPELSSFLNSEPYLTINKSRYFLAELPPMTAPPGWDRFLLSFLSAGKVPILTHPERNPWFVNHPEAIYNFVLQGGMVQITAMSLIGRCGPNAQEFSQFLLSHNLVHAIATDAHDAGERPPLLYQAVKAAEKVIGEERALALVTTIPEAIIKGKTVAFANPVPFTSIPKRKSWIQRLLPS